MDADMQDVEVGTIKAPSAAEVAEAANKIWRETLAHPELKAQAEAATGANLSDEWAQTARFTAVQEGDGDGLIATIVVHLIAMEVAHGAQIFGKWILPRLLNLLRGAL